MSYPHGNLSPMTDQLLDYRSTTPGLEPECEVLVDGHWCEGYVRGWYRYTDGWHASVQYSVTAQVKGIEFPANHLATFPADQVRKAEAPA